MKRRQTIMTCLLLFSLAFAPLKAVVAMSMSMGAQTPATTMVDCEDVHGSHGAHDSAGHGCVDDVSGHTICDDGQCVHCVFCTAAVGDHAWGDVVNPSVQPDSRSTTFSSIDLPDEGRPPRPL